MNHTMNMITDHNYNYKYDVNGVLEILGKLTASVASQQQIDPSISEYGDLIHSIFFITRVWQKIQKNLRASR